MLQPGCLRLQQQGLKSKLDQEEGLEEPESSFVRERVFVNTSLRLITQQLLTSSGLGTGISFFFFFKWRMRECYEITAHEMLMDGAGTKHSVCLSTGRTEGLIWASLALGEFRGEAIWGLFLQEFSQDKSV